MDLQKIDLNDIEKEQISYWLSKPNVSTKFYKEPELLESTIQVVKLVCELLNQTDEVFITSVDILEIYVQRKSFSSYNKPNSILILTCCVVISSKLVGSCTEIKMSVLQQVIQKLIKKDVDKQTLKETELDIILTVEKLPLSTTATDLCMFLEYYIKNLKLRIDLKPLCLELLNITYISRKKVFVQLKSIYVTSSDAFRVFQQLVCNKFYYPGGIVACALRITKFSNFLNVKQIIEDIANIGQIHYDHIHLLSNVLRQLVDTNST
ncbi:hypothetical protein RN001_014049 [Aquatica leii]|uniref:Cyclin N-terminal domain-containing protein n=1 Tax=Aquatica leii TaxID=1421715 RepID=A0AAN7P111_9COLE|nr:hypothetical protein RN001_014049 [Aquatica leii]